MRRLLRIVSTDPGGPDSIVCARADVVLGHIRCGLGTGVERQIDQILDQAGVTGATGACVLDACDRAVARAPRTSARRSETEAHR